MLHRQGHGHPGRAAKRRLAPGMTIPRAFARMLAAISITSVANVQSLDTSALKKKSAPRPPPSACASKASDQYRALVDLAKYPIDDLQGEACQRIIDEAKKKWREIGAVDFPGFVRQDKLRQLAVEVWERLPVTCALDTVTY